MIQDNINFSDSYIESLSNLTEKLNTILIQNGFWLYVDLLEKIRNVAQSKNEYDFNILINNNALFGGSGALWEIYIENKKERIKFNTTFCQYIDNIKMMGINNERIKQVREHLPLLI